MADSAKNAGDALEKEHVHKVYDAIANHFSDTRYKPWPVVDDFLKTQPHGSLGADVGCGNGKYLGVNKDIFIIGSDRCKNLIDVVYDRGYEGMVADNLSLPYRDSSFDFVISIAVIHHFSTGERRIDAVRELCRVLRPGGKLLIFVWALEQTGKRKYNHQDVFVPWKLRKSTESTSEEVFQRFYHLFSENELKTLVSNIKNLKVDVSGYDRDNWYVICSKDGE